MAPSRTDPLKRLPAGLPDLPPGLEANYKDIHAHPELSTRETRVGAMAIATMAWVAA